MQETSVAVKRKISNASIIAVMMVVGIHTAGTTYQLGSAMWWFEQFCHYGLFKIAVPFFFFCSGYFLARHVDEPFWWIIECRKRFWSLVIPYLVWCFLCAALPALCWKIYDYIRGCSVHSLIYNISLSDIFGLSICGTPIAVPLWYIRCLIVLVVISPICVFAIRRIQWRFLLILYLMSLIVEGLGLRQEINITMFRFFFSINGLFWFSVGIYSRLKYPELRGVGFAKSMSYSALGCLIVLASSLVCYITKVDVHGLASVIYTPLLLVGLWPLVPSIPQRGVVQSSTFPIYCMHGLVIYSVSWANSNEYLFASWMFRWIAGMLGAFSVSLILKHVCSPLARFLFGGR